jgi:hypothetical protein
VNKLLRLVFLLLAFGSFYVGRAQLIPEDTSTHEPFFKAAKFDSKCNVGIEAVPTQILKTKAAMMLGMNLNWVINHKFVLSAKYHVLTTPLNIRPIIAPDRSDTVLLKHHFAGLAFSYIVAHNKKFSFQPELAGGWASVTYNDKKSRKDFALILPAVYGIYNATKYFRFGLGLNYRLAIGGSLNGLKDSHLSGIGGVVFMRVGTF